MTSYLAHRRRNRPALSLLLPERSRYNRRQQLAEATNRIQGAVIGRRWWVLEAGEVYVGAIDSVPESAIGSRHHCRHSKAAYRRVAPKQRTIYGVKLHLVVSAVGLLNFTPEAARAPSASLAEQPLIDMAGLTVLGNKGYIDGPLHQQLA